VLAPTRSTSHVFEKEFERAHSFSPHSVFIRAVADENCKTSFFVQFPFHVYNTHDSCVMSTIFCHQKMLIIKV